MTLIFMFPGQSSRYDGMLHKLMELRPANRTLMAAASDLLRRDLVQHYRPGNEAAYARNRDVQVGVFLANHMFLQIVQDAGIDAPLSLGLSLGEYNHLVHIGALDFRQALLTVEQRGEAYDAGPRGAMASVFPIELEELEQIAARAAGDDVLEVVNLNSPQQHVLSGDTPALERAQALIEDETFANAVVIERQVPMHCSTFAPVGRRLREHLQTVRFSRPQLPYLPNREGRMIEAPTDEQFVELLATHVHSPVLWRRSIDHVVACHPDAVFVEVGPLAVLYNLLNRKWHRVPRYRTDSAEETAAHLERLLGELRGLEPGVHAYRGREASAGECRTTA